MGMSNGDSEREHELSELLREVRALREALDQLKAGPVVQPSLPPEYQVLVRTQPVLPPEYNVAVRIQPAFPPDYAVAVRPAFPPEYAVAVRLPRPGEQVIDPPVDEPRAEQ